MHPHRKHTDIEKVGDGVSVLKYLAPYIFRVAISNKNILKVTDTHVTFRYRESKTRKIKVQTLPGEQFMHRFLQHVLPKGFQKVRTYGLWHPKQRHKLEIVKEQLQPSKDSAAAPPDPSQDQTETTKPSSAVFCCDECGHVMARIGKVPKKRGPPLW